MRSIVIDAAGWLQRRLYDLVATAAAFIMAPYWLVRSGGRMARFAQRYGSVPAGVRRATDFSGCIWFHAASVGEVGVLARVVPRLALLTPGLPVVVSTVTATGLNRARQLLGNQAELLHLPIDAPFLVRRAVRMLHPQAMVIAETELWPNLIRALVRYGSRVVVVNGRLTESSFRRYRLARPGLRPLLARIDAFCVKSNGDRERFVALGADPGAVHVVGDLKSEPIPGIESATLSERRSELAIPADRPVFVAGSTREGEEPLILEAFGQLLESRPDLLLVIAPRHPHRADAVERLIAAEDYRWLRRTAQEGRDLSNTQVLILDTMGELERIFAASDVAFVGGTMVPVGGHNLLEPAMYGVPVLFGPHTEATGGADHMLLEAEGGIRVTDPGEMAGAVRMLIEGDERRQQVGGAARAAVSRSRGALEKTLFHYRRALGMGLVAPRAGHSDRGSRGPRADEVPHGQVDGADA
jgi:3-deoxy-D-manno-octulosonic-acid transferase